MEQKSMTVRMPVDQADTLEAVARVENLSVAEAIRGAIDAYIDARRQDEAFQRRLKASLERNREILEQLART